MGEIINWAAVKELTFNYQNQWVYIVNNRVFPM